MNRICRRLATAGFAAVLQAGVAGAVLAQGVTTPGAPQGDAANGQPAEPAAPPGVAQQPEERPVLYVTGMEVMRTVTAPQIDIVRVTGLAASKGWSYPQLVPTETGVPADGMLDLQLIATVPEESEDADGFVPVSAVLVLEADDPYKGVRVRGAENAIEVKQVPGSNVASVAVNDCHDCVGKKFVAAGRAQSGQSGIVRQEDLPRELRVIAPSSGIQGDTPRPDRLTLILGEDDTITEAFWE